MAEQESKEGFEATQYDDKGNILLPPPPVVAAKAKRPTVAGLKKELDELKADIEESILSWLGELAARLEAIESIGPENIPSYVSDSTERFEKIETAIGALSDALRSHLNEPAATPQQPETELEFAQPPQTQASGQARDGDIGSLKQTYPPQPMTSGAVDVSGIAAIANVCLTMSDVLIVTRALKEIPELIDAERIEILNLACRSSGVILTPGLQIRAGVRFMGA